MTEQNTQVPANTPEVLSPEQIAAKELADAQSKAQAAKERLAQIENLKLQQLQIQQMERLGAEQRRINEERERHLEAERRIRERREKEERERREAEARKRQEEAELQRQVAEAEAAIEKRKKHEAELRRIADEQFRLEEAARQAEADLYRQKPPVLTHDIKIDPATRHENLALTEESKDADRDTQGRLRLFSRTNTGFAPDYNAVDPMASAPPTTQAEYTTPVEFEIKNGQLSERVFQKLFGPANKFSFCLRPIDGTLGAGGYYWTITGIFSARDWPHGSPVWIEWNPTSGYELHSVRTKQVLSLTPLAINELVRFEPLPAEIKLEGAANV